MTEAVQRYLENGAPLKIMHGEYEGTLVDIQPLNDGYVCGIYRFPRGTSCGGPILKIIEATALPHLDTGN